MKGRVVAFALLAGGCTAPPSGAPADVRAARATDVAAPAAGAIRALGTEPFWTVEWDGERAARYITPDTPRGEAVSGVVERGDRTRRFAGTLGGRPFILTVTPGACSDGMSDRRYSLRALLQVRGETRQGCAAPR